MHLAVPVRLSVRFLCLSVSVWGSALPSAAKSDRSHYQSKVFVYVSVIRMLMWIIARMRSIGFYFTRSFTLLVCSLY